MRKHVLQEHDIILVVAFLTDPPGGWRRGRDRAVVVGPTTACEKPPGDNGYPDQSVDIHRQPASFTHRPVGKRDGRTAAASTAESLRARDGGDHNDHLS